MTPEQFSRLISAGILLLDGATGTHLQAAGMPAGVCPETWVLEHPAILQNLQRAYFAAGSRIVYTFTFGANRPKLGHYQSGVTDVADLNRRLAAITTAVRDEAQLARPECPVYVAGDLAPTGRFLFPAGDLTLAELVDIYREQVRGLLAAGVDLFVVETIMDLAEARAAVLAVRAECDLPVLVSLTVEASGRTLAGNTLIAGLLTLSSLGISAFGVNCSFGPEKLGSLVETLQAVSPIPLLVKPNAGLPRLDAGRTVFPMDPQAFALAMQPLANQAVRLLGGCCGTSPQHIQQLHDSLSVDAKLTAAIGTRPAELPCMICSSRTTWTIDHPRSLPVVTCSDPDSLVDEVFEANETDPPALCLDLDGAAEIPADADALLEALQQLQVMVSTPLIFRSENPELLGRLIYHYNGRAGIITNRTERLAGALYL